jgi:hypothetical protein
MKLTANRIDVLRELQGCEQAKYAGRKYNLPDGRQLRMYTPLEFGGMNGSHHSHTAKALAKAGLVDRYKYSTGHLNNFKSRVKGACAFALTDKGRELLQQLDAAK